jgi:hypothetical protein
MRKHALYRERRQDEVGAVGTTTMATMTMPRIETIAVALRVPVLLPVLGRRLVVVLQLQLPPSEKAPTSRPGTPQLHWDRY